MIFFKYIVVLVGFGVLASCGSTKSTAATKKPKKATTEFSTKDYPYLEAFHQGVRLKMVGDVDGAITAFNTCLTIKQNDDAVYFALAQLELKKGNKSQALTHFTKASQLDPKNIWYIKEMAYLHYDNQEFEKAVPEFKKLVEHEAKNLEWLYGYGDCLLRTGKVQDAINVLTKAEDIMGVNPDLSVEKYNLYMSLKKETEAINEINKAREVFPEDPQLIATLVDHYFQKGQAAKAIELLEQLVLADPDNGRAHLALGDVYRQQGKVKESFEQFEAAFKCADVDIDAKMKVLIAFQEISYKPEQGAIDLMKLVVEQHPLDAKSHSIRADYMLALEDEEEAMISYRKAAELDPDQYPVWNQLLLLEYQNGKFEELYTDSKRCLEYFTAMPTIFLLNGIGAIQTKHFDEAITSLETGKSLLIDDKGMEAEFYGQLGDAYMSSKKYAEGKENFDKALKLDPKSNLIKNNYSYKLAVAKIDLEKALSLINQALASSPNQVSYLDTKGFILFQMNKFEEAKGFFEEAMKLNATEPDINDHLGDVYFKLKDVDNALKFWNKAKELGSKNKNLAKKIETKSYYEPSYD